jgi:4-amino-4-deoxychorismate lyase
MESTLRRGAGAPDLKLIETLGWDGAAFVRLDLHLARLAGAAAQLGWDCDLAAVRAALFGAVAGTAARVRMTLDAAGVVEVTVAAMPEKAAVWRVGLAGVRLSSADPWLGVKSTRRAVYDEARAQLPTGLDEVIFQNERGEVCDGSITSVFFDLGDGLCTPPLSCGLLPGVLRAEMLALGVVQEAVLMARDLDRARLWVGNSVRGLIRARFVA